MYALDWKRQAESDLLKIAQHIAQDSPDAADHLLGLIVARAEALRNHPALYRVGRQRGTREMVVHPHYIVIYRVQKTVVEILRVKHTARRWPKT